MKMTKAALMLLPSLLLAIPVMAHDGEDHEHKKAQKTEKSKAPKTMYECPMKDSPAQDKPGKCPTCGMPLEKVSTAPGAKKAALDEPKCTCAKENHASHEGDCPTCAMKAGKTTSPTNAACKDGQNC